jgi:uncharacterized protein with HEPN domain
MPQRDPGVYLEDIEHYATAAVRFTSGFSLEQYLADEKTRAAVERVLEVLFVSQWCLLVSALSASRT